MRVQGFLYSHCGGPGFDLCPVTLYLIWVNEPSNVIPQGWNITSAFRASDEYKQPNEISIFI
jgi:hypothetical protein